MHIAEGSKIFSAERLKGEHKQITVFTSKKGRGEISI